jgi:hypothetical protein
MDRAVSGNILLEFVSEFISVVDKNNLKYIIVSGFVAIAHGRSRGTEDIDLIIEKISFNKFESFFNDLINAGFECLQGVNAKELFEDYLLENLSIRFVKKGTFVPDMELKLEKDFLDKTQLNERKKLPLTGMPFYFSSIETNIAFKEELLKSEKDLEDAKHLRTIYEGELNEKKIIELKKLIKKFRLKVI